MMDAFIVSGDLCISVPIGLGDLIYLQAQLKAVEDRFNKIRISPDLAIIQKFGAETDSNAERLRFTKKFFDLIFRGDKYIYAPNRKYRFANIITLNNKFGFQFMRPNLIDELCDGTRITKKKYIVITTKVRELNYLERYLPHKKKIFDAIRTLADKYSVVLLGEREVDFISKEYIKHGKNKIFCIYDDIMQNLNDYDVLDYTVEVLGFTPPDINNLRQDCLTMSNAECVISMGIGGNFCLSAAVSKSVINLRASAPIADRAMGVIYPNAPGDNVFSTKNVDEFVSYCNEFASRQE